MPSENVTRATPSDQLLFDWSGPEKTNDNQPLERAADGHQPGREHAKVDAFCPSLFTNSTGSRDAELPGEFHYDRGHPWHYYRDGDNAPPVPFDDIPPAGDYGGSLERELPKPAPKRIIRARELLAAERRDLNEARARYEEVIDRGAEALSRYDREIAYGGNDELARAGTLALLFSQISWRRGRIAYLEQFDSRQLGRSK